MLKFLVFFLLFAIADLCMIMLGIRVERSIVAMMA